jgi:hypothetical protein
MIRNLLNIAICLCPTPLLAAQPGVPAGIVLPERTKIELIPLGDVATEAASSGTRVRFAVAGDVVVNGVIAIPAGTPITGIVTDSKRGSHKMTDDGRLTIRARDLGPGKQIFVRVKEARSADRAGGYWSEPGGRGAGIAIVVVCILIAVLGMGTH